MEPWRSAIVQALAGNIDGAISLVGDETSPEAALALRATLARAEPRLFAMPSIGELERLRGPAVAIAAASIARDAVVRLDAAALDRASQIASLRCEGDEGARIEAEAVSAWAAYFGGRLEGARDRAREIEARAAKAHLAHVVIETASLAAMLALGDGDLESATSIARRASRMARTEALPQQEYLAHTVLARARRHGGRPHLSTRILGALARVAPSTWQGWLALELAMAGAPGEVPADAGEPAASLARSIVAMMQSASRGDAAALEAAIAEAWARARASPFRSEIADLIVAIDPRRALPEAGPLTEFALGRVDALPGSLVGAASLARPGELAAQVRVVASVGGAARRVLAIGTALATGHVEIASESGARQHRREAALSILALAGPEGVSKGDLFRAVWGFAFVPHLHQGVLDVLLHRVRAALGEAAELVRRESRVLLHLHSPILVADPRAEQPLDDRVLGLVSRGGSKAREVALELGIPLRTVQAALGRLVEEGECERHGEGQKVEYRVEDTTFREPTRR